MTKRNGTAGLVVAIRNGTTNIIYRLLKFIAKPAVTDVIAMVLGAAISAKLGRRLWVWRFDLEGAREIHATHGRYVRSAACCVALAILRLGGSA